MSDKVVQRKAQRDSYLRGFARAIGVLAREYGSPAMAADIARMSGIRFRELMDAGIDPFDLRLLRSEMLRLENQPLAELKGDEVSD